MSQAPAPEPAPATGPPPPADPPPRRRRRGLALVIVLVVLLALAGVAVGGDRAAATAAESVLARQLQAELSTPQPPEVQIGGFPFLVQLARGRYSSIHVVAADATVPVEGRKAVVLSRADATLEDVAALDSGRSVTAGKIDATVLISYASLSDQIGLPTASAGNGVIEISFDVPIGSLQVKGTATARPELDAGSQQITFRDAAISITSGSEGQEIADAVGQVVLRPITVADVPYGLSLRGLQVRDDGIELVGTATNVPLRR